MKIKNLVIKFSKFSLVGAFMTVLSLALAYLFLDVLYTPLYITYVINNLVMIFISYQLNRTFTFKAEHCAASMLLYYLVYVSGMVLGVVLLWLFAKILPFSNWWLTICVLPFTMISNFILSKLVFDRPKL